jgi:hypothetical protein
MIKPATDQLPPELGSVKTNPGQVCAERACPSRCAVKRQPTKLVPGTLLCPAAPESSELRIREAPARVLLKPFAPRAAHAQAADFLRGVQMSANLGRLAAQAMREPLTQHEKEGIIVLTQVRPGSHTY